MRQWPHKLILACALLLAAPAAAQLPDLIGTWKGTGYAVRLGPSHYRTTKDVEAAFLDKAVEFTYVIKRQHGHRLAGEMSSERGKRPFSGAMQQDNRGGIILDNNGQYIFTLMDPTPSTSATAASIPITNKSSVFG